MRDPRASPRPRVLNRAVLQPVGNTKAPWIDRRHDGLDPPGDELSLAEPDDRGLIEIVARTRIGVAYAGG